MAGRGWPPRREWSRRGARDDRLVVPSKRRTARARHHRRVTVAWARIGRTADGAAVHPRRVGAGRRPPNSLSAIASPTDGVRVWVARPERSSSDLRSTARASTSRRRRPRDRAGSSDGEPVWERDDRHQADGAAGLRGPRVRWRGGQALLQPPRRAARSTGASASGAAVVGRPVADDTHVYYVALDNLLRAHDRRTADALEKRSPLPAVCRTVAGGRERGGTWPAARSRCSMRARGRRRFNWTFASSLATLPLLIEPTEKGLPGLRR